MNNQADRGSVDRCRRMVLRDLRRASANFGFPRIKYGAGLVKPGMTGEAMSTLDKLNLLLKRAGESITVEPDGHRGCIFIMNLPAVRDARVRPPEVIMDPYPVAAWISFN